MHWPGGQRKGWLLLAQICSTAISRADLCTTVTRFRHSNGNALAGGQCKMPLQQNYFFTLFGSSSFFIEICYTPANN